MLDVPLGENLSFRVAEFILNRVIDYGYSCEDEIFYESTRRLDVSMLETNFEYYDRDIYIYVIQDMRDQPSNYDDITEVAVIQVFQLLRAYNFDWDEDLIATAENMGITKVARWLKCNGCQNAPILPSLADFI